MQNLLISLPIAKAVSLPPMYQPAELRNVHLSRRFARIQAFERANQIALICLTRRAQCRPKTFRRPDWFLV